MGLLYELFRFAISRPLFVIFNPLIVRPPIVRFRRLFVVLSKNNYFIVHRLSTPLKLAQLYISIPRYKVYYRINYLSFYYCLPNLVIAAEAITYFLKSYHHDGDKLPKPTKLQQRNAENE